MKIESHNRARHAPRPDRNGPGRDAVLPAGAGLPLLLLLP